MEPVEQEQDDEPVKPERQEVQVEEDEQVRHPTIRSEHITHKDTPLSTYPELHGQVDPEATLFIDAEQVKQLVIVPEQVRQL